MEPNDTDMGSVRDNELRELLDGVDVYQGDTEIDDYGQALICISQEIDGSLPDDSLRFDWSRYSRERASSTLARHADWLRETFDDLCRGPGRLHL